MKIVIADKLSQEHSTEFRGLPVIIEWPKGSTRVGEKPDGTPFKTEMKADYGYIPDTTAAGDQEKLDIYIGPNPDAEYAYIVEQLTPEGEFDEYKVLLGFDSLEDAEETYLEHVPEEQLGDISEVEFEYLFDTVKEKQKEAAEKRSTLLDQGGVITHYNGDKVGVMLANGEVEEFSKDALESVEQWREGDKAIYIGPRGSTYGGGLEIGSPITVDHVRKDKTGKIVWVSGVTEDGTPSRFTVNQLRKAARKIAADDKYTVIEAFLKNYKHEVDFYDEVAHLVQDKLDQALQDAGIKAVVSSRAKTPDRLKKKLYKRDMKRHYKTFRDIDDDIIDLAGCRVALYMPADRATVGQIVEQLFVPVRPSKNFPESSKPEEGDTLGYTATHYLVRLRPETLRKKELRYADTQIEIQVASVLMHAWAEVAHDLLYKPEKGELTPEEKNSLNNLNSLVQEGERQLEKLQSSMENRTDENLRFEIAAALATSLKARSMGKTASLTMGDVEKAAKIIVGRKSVWATYMQATETLRKARWEKRELTDDHRKEWESAGHTDESLYIYEAMKKLAPGKSISTLWVLPNRDEVIAEAQRLKTEATKEK